MIAAELISAERLTTERLVLARLEPEHAGALFPLVNDWNVVRMLAARPWPVTLQDVEEYTVRGAGPAAESIDFAVLVDGAPIGVVAVKKPATGNPPRTMPRLGYWLGRPHWGFGYATEALTALTRFAFDRFQAEMVGAGVFSDNPASRRVLEKLGFRHVGRYSLHCRSRDASVEVDDMNLTRAAWEARR